MENDLDRLNDLDPLDMIKDDAYVDSLILAHRRRREEGQGRAKKETGPKIDLVELGLLKKPEPVKVVRRL